MRTPSTFETAAVLRLLLGNYNAEKAFKRNREQHDLSRENNARANVCAMMLRHLRAGREVGAAWSLTAHHPDLDPDAVKAVHEYAERILQGKIAPPERRGP